ncbi:MAG: aminotransferase class V-fold PLP-dependent enzyme [Candidatus Latescibacteria bacterium]|nr:aminotransferase class V-fold PLP-dependent enzyme [bacterium]MBD3424709.1 aminotransferase class V-fold PLP-dependent enzyme [Candidatus Latescibacterota bacterium]
MSKIPFLSLKETTSKVRDEVDSVISDIIDNTAFVLGPRVESFENKFAGYCGTKYAAGTSSGTSAIILALQGFGIGEGDEVITVPNTFIATAEAIALAGAKPVLVDVLNDTALIDPGKIEEAITPRTRAIMPVHLFGQCCDMDPIMDIARKNDLIVIEDACQAHGATYKGRRAGSLGHAGAFSFYPSKNLGAFGEGGMVTSDDLDCIEMIKGLRHHGQLKKNEHTVIGYNYRLQAIQAAVLEVKLPYLDELNSSRRELANRYRSKLNGTDYWIPAESPDCSSVYHLFPVGCPDKKKVTERLDREDIGWGEHYPVPVHLQPAFSHLEYGEGSFPASEELMKKSITLPMFPELEIEQVDRVCEVLKSI